MKKPTWLLLIVFVVGPIGCLPEDTERSEQCPQKAEPCRLEVKGVQIRNDYVEFEYSITNTFSCDIWVCDDVEDSTMSDAHRDVETRIVDGTLWVKLRFALESNVMLPAGVLASYRRLAPGESYCGVIFCRVPVPNHSPVYGFRFDPGQRCRLCCRRAVVEVGYFAENLPELLSQSIDSLLRSEFFWESLTQDPNTAFVSNLSDCLDRERSVCVVIDDVHIPCIAIVDDGDSG